MRRWTAIILALVLTLGFPLSAKAATTEEVEPHGDMVLYCPRCGNMGSYVREWWEHTYYYSRLWQEYECVIETNNEGQLVGCGFRWNTVIFETSYVKSDDIQEEDFQ